MLSDGSRMDNGEVGKIRCYQSVIRRISVTVRNLVNDSDCDFGLVLRRAELFFSSYEGRLCGSFSSFNRQPQSFDAKLQRHAQSMARIGNATTNIRKHCANGIGIDFVFRTSDIKCALDLIRCCERLTANFDLSGEGIGSAGQGRRAVSWKFGNIAKAGSVAALVNAWMLPQSGNHPVNSTSARSNHSRVVVRSKKSGRLNV